MKKIVLIVFCLCFMAWGQDKANENAPALTIYNQNFFVARERFHGIVSGREPC